MWYFAATPVLDAADQWHPSFEELWSNPALRRGVAGFGSRSGDLGYIAEDAGQEVGAAWWRKLRGIAGVSELPQLERYLTIAVVPSHRHRGVGKALLERLLADARASAEVTEVGLEVKEANAAAFALYLKMGFTVRGQANGLIAMSYDASIKKAS